MQYKAFIVIATLALLGPANLNAATKEGLLYVQVKESRLRSQPQFWATSVADLSYGTALVALSAAPSDKSWIKAKLGETEGFVHVSAITSRKVVLSTSADASKKQVDPSSVVMAGKGFNSQVENSYKSSKGLDFASVNEVEQYKVQSTEEETFLRDGKLLEK